VPWCLSGFFLSQRREGAKNRAVNGTENKQSILSEEKVFPKTTFL
jgi:hypothetical protein